MAGEIAFAMPRAEEVTSKVVGLGGAGIAGVIEGFVVKIAPNLGALELPVKWLTFIAVPLAGAAVALVTKGILSDLAFGGGCGGAGVFGFLLPELVAPITGAKKGGGGGQLTPEQQAALAARRGVKQLPPGARFAPERAAMAAVGAGYE